ncbi:hypothetical protein [Paracoccus aestuariivivens]|uniref:Uncharacterized protein n=1 Tax=Paracoccus aestuariivivens TaxID=1820333 RepID=A0A6L6J9F5_9RHOB|nr:hypothetical protein [Paracoccus aestuariivivens]MTH78156.1 hypothetical protein [Paracoccus aestuariivivens]
MTCQHLPHLIAVALFSASMTVPLAAQTAPATQQTPVTGQTATIAKSDCPPAAAQAEPATKDTATTDGTAPSNSGSTGWSGGTGGSHIGTNPQGGSQHTKTWHSPTARGIDLKGRPEPAPVC